MFEKRDDGCIRLLDTSVITSAQWSKIHNKFNYLGYGLPDIDFTVNYLKRGTWLNLDQSIAVLEVLGCSSNKSSFSNEQISRDNQLAKDIFGTTSLWKKAGYVLLDGSMLDFSEGQSYRTLDHRSISQAMEDSLPDDYDYSTPLVMFVAYGNIRVNCSGFELSKRPTAAQKKQLSTYLRNNNDVYIDIANENGQIIKSLSYEGFISPSRVFMDIDEFFDMVA